MLHIHIAKTLFKIASRSPYRVILGCIIYSSFMLEVAIDI